MPVYINSPASKTIKGDIKLLKAGFGALSIGSVGYQAVDYVDIPALTDYGSKFGYVYFMLDVWREIGAQAINMNTSQTSGDPTAANRPGATSTTGSRAWTRTEVFPSVVQDSINYAQIGNVTSANISDNGFWGSPVNPNRIYFNIQRNTSSVFAWQWIVYVIYPDVKT